MEASPIWNPAQLQRLAAYGAEHFDAAEDLLLLDLPKNIHSQHLGDGPKHPTRESLMYALALLGLRQDEARALRIIDRVLDLQETDEAAGPLHGLWHYYLEEKVTDWPFPDRNWADFIGMNLVLIRRRLPADATYLRRKVDEALIRAARCIRTRDVDLNYTNIALKGAFVTLAVAELFHDEALEAYAMERLRKLAVIFQTGIPEYNSPPYYGVGLAVLMAMDEVFENPEARDIARSIQHLFWRNLVRRLHVPSRELAGPHSRTYATTISEQPGYLGPLFEKASGGRFQYPASARERDPFAALWACLLPVDVPAEVGSLLANPDRTEDLRETAVTFPEGSSTILTTHLRPAFCLGSVNFQDGWEQRQNLIAYWPGERGPGVLKQHYDHDTRPCCSGFFASAQNGGRVLAASFIARHADDHVSFKVEGVEASFLGTIFDLDPSSDEWEVFIDCRPVNEGRHSLFPGETVFIRLPQVWIALTVLRHGVAYEGVDICATPYLELLPNRARFKFPHYEGPPQNFLWRGFTSTQTVCALVLDDPGPDWCAWCAKQTAIRTEPHSDARRLEVQWGDLSLTVPNTALDESEIRSFYKV